MYIRRMLHAYMKNLYSTYVLYIFLIHMCFRIFFLTCVYTCLYGYTYTYNANNEEYRNKYIYEELRTCCHTLYIHIYYINSSYVYVVHYSYIFRHYVYIYMHTYIQVCNYVYTVHIIHTHALPYILYTIHILHTCSYVYCAHVSKYTHVYMYLHV